MDGYKVLRIMCIIPIGISLLICLISMGNGVSIGLFGEVNVCYGTDAFIWMGLYMLNFFWWLYLICIAGIIFSAIQIGRRKKTGKKNL